MRGEKRCHQSCKQGLGYGQVTAVWDGDTWRRGPATEAHAYEQKGRTDKCPNLPFGLESLEEQVVRLTVLEILYTKRRSEPTDPGVFSRDIERLTARPQEHLEFTIWFLVQKKFMTRDDNSRLHLTAEGAEYLEQNYHAKLQQKRLQASNENG